MGKCLETGRQEIETREIADTGVLRKIQSVVETQQVRQDLWSEMNG